MRKDLTFLSSSLTQRLSTCFWILVDHPPSRPCRGVQNRREGRRCPRPGLESIVSHQQWLCKHGYLTSMTKPRPRVARIFSEGLRGTSQRWSLSIAQKKAENNGIPTAVSVPWEQEGKTPSPLKWWQRGVCQVGCGGVCTLKPHPSSVGSPKTTSAHHWAANKGSFPASPAHCHPSTPGFLQCPGEPTQGFPTPTGYLSHL